MDFKELKELMDSYKKSIFNFTRREWCTSLPLVPEEDGYYVTIRIGYVGVYQVLDEFRDGKWQFSTLDGSRIVAYNRNKVTL